MDNFHGRMMNIQTDRMGASFDRQPLRGRDIKLAYKIGHRDARHAAAEIANEADFEIERLRDLLAKSIRREEIIEAENERLRHGLRMILNISPGPYAVTIIHNTATEAIKGEK
jgi:hypothetical protein